MSDEPRPGERVSAAPLPADAALCFIGHIETPFATRADCPRQGDPEHGPECRLVLRAPWDGALAGLERFEAIDVLYWLDHARRDLITQSPRGDGATRGTFSLRSPVRPNPIGLSKARLLGIDGNVVHLRGLDCIDGTPLIDIKPARCEFTVQARAKGVD